MARESGVLRDRLRVLDSTPIYDAVTTEDTITQLRAVIRKMLAALRVDYPVLAVEAKTVCVRDDEYLSPGRPSCDWDDRDAKEELVDALVRDARTVLGVLDGHVLGGVAADAAELLAIVAGQDVEQDEDGQFGIVRGVARDRIISTVDPEARHGHKSRSRRFDGYKGHVSIDPDSELIDEVTVTPANTADQDTAVDLLEPCVDLDHKPVVMGDSAYAGGQLREALDEAGFDVHAKVPPASNRDGMLSKDHFEIDLANNTVWCLANMDARIRWHHDGTGTAVFGSACRGCVYRDECTTAINGRTISISRHEARILKAKHDQQAPQWRAEYRAQRPKVERKIGHLTRQIHGGRKARTRGIKHVLTDFVTRAAAINLARLHTLNVTHNGTGWTTR
jgi:IS5 family transposase